jgi:signal transduction histidine kinase
VLRVINASPGDLAPVFEAMLDKATRLCEAVFGDMFTCDGDVARPVAFRNTPPSYAEAVSREPVLLKTALGPGFPDGPVVHIPDLAAAESYRRRIPLVVDAVELGAIRSFLVVPLLKDGSLVGLVAMYRHEVRPFTDKFALLQTFAGQAVLAIENAGLFQEAGRARAEAEAAVADLRRAQDRLIQSEKMASLGQLTAGIAREIKNPLNFVNNFAGLSVELLDELKEAAAEAVAALDADKRADIEETIAMLTCNLDKIAEHGRRADNIVKSMLDVSGERRTVDLNAMVDEALNLAYHGTRAQDQSFNITMERNFDPALAPIELAPQEMTRVFLNLSGNGFYAATMRQRDAANAGLRPTLTVATRDDGDMVEVRVRDNGTGIPPDIKDKLFQPFFTTKPTGEGTGLGLSISYDIVTQQHGHRYPTARRDDHGRERAGFLHRIYRPPATPPASRSIRGSHECRHLGRGRRIRCCGPLSPALSP